MNAVDARINKMLNELATSAPASIAIEDADTTVDQRRGRTAFIAISIMFVLVGLIGVSLARQGAKPDPAGDGPPAWFTEVSGLLPDAYQTVAIGGLDETNLRLAAIDLKTGTGLEIRVSKVPIEPDPSGIDLPHFSDSHGEWFEFNDGANLVTPDGRQAQVTCVVLGSPESRCSDRPDYRLDQQQLRDITAKIAGTLTPARLAAWPSATPLGMTVEQVDAVVAGIEPRVERLYKIPLANGFTIAYTTDGTTEAVLVSITTGYIGNPEDQMRILSDITVGTLGDTLIVVARAPGADIPHQSILEALLTIAS